MAVSEILQSLGSFEFNLSGRIPREILDSLDYFGHVAILPGRVDTVQAGNNSLTAARYVGVVRKKKISSGDGSEIGDDITIGGVGIAFWLGDDDTDRGKGAIIENTLTFTNETFANTVRDLLPASVSEGTLYSVAGTFSSTFQFVTPRSAVQYVCDTMSTNSVPVSWRVNGDASLDAGPESSLYVTNPTCVVVRKGFGEDVALRALEGSMDVDQDVEDFSTRVVLLAEGDGASTATGSADISGVLNPYKDLHGNPLVMTRLVSESETSTANADTRAQLQLNRFTGTRDALTLSANDYDVHGTFNVGDYIWVYDPDAGLVDTNNEIIFRGERLNPVKLQVHETSWSITNGYSVGYRASNGTWYDLTDYVQFETQADSKITVGEFSRTLSVSSGETVGTRPNADTSTPGSGAWITPFQLVNYQDDLGFTRSRVLLAWDAPNNTDGTTVLDGDHYEIQVRVDTDAIYPQTWSSISSTTWNDLGTWDQPFTPALSAWQTFYVAWGESTYFLNDLATGVGYDVRIRLVDTAGNIGDWVATTFITTQDNIPPSTPAAPSVAGSRIAVQVTHELGKATGGTFNLEQDLAHLEIHVDYEPHFTPSADTLKGTVIANQGMITAQIPAVVTVQVDETSTRYVRVIAVDRAGNKSLASEAASATALLIDDAHISDLTVSKVTAGTISADFLLGARIKTADSGARVELNRNGLQAFNSAGVQTVNVDSSTGNVTIAGTFRSTTDNLGAVEIGQGDDVGTIRFYSPDGSTFARIYSLDDPTAPGETADIKIMSSFDDEGIASLTANLADRWVGGRLTAEDGLLTFKGGGFYANNDRAYMTYSPAASAGTLSGNNVEVTSSYSIIGYNRGLSTEQTLWLDNNNIKMLGNFVNFTTSYANQALLSGDVGFTGTATSVSISYGITVDSPFYPLAMIRDDAGRDGIFMTSSPSTTGFVLQWATATNAAFGIHFWAWRM
ncbi:hypothetical protein OG601_24145 [Streptomyces sp. NBC_01239]|uniref:hypothetical protein n=1 Tax=Streptomyces sp. NBC_01239 TaxID=2903792 RepID=UPI002258D7E3|nr:hypothetical protein [Streptomyces sp. NBC_01239]MCX4813694.1 hypothetical protein [Streptomyces sp. NBC_01239]